MLKRFRIFEGFNNDLNASDQWIIPWQFTVFSFHGYSVDRSKSVRSNQKLDRAPHK